MFRDVGATRYRSGLDMRVRVTTTRNALDASASLASTNPSHILLAVAQHIPIIPFSIHTSYNVAKAATTVTSHDGCLHSRKTFSKSSRRYELSPHKLCITDFDLQKSCLLSHESELQEGQHRKSSKMHQSQNYRFPKLSQLLE